MIDLKTARNQADKLVEDNVPKASTLRGWAMKDLISGRCGYGTKGAGTVGLYPDYLVLEIATAVALKGRYNLKNIKAARKHFVNMFKEQLENKEPIAAKIDGEIVMNDRTGKIFEMMDFLNEENELIKKAREADDPNQRAFYFEKASQLSKKTDLINSYIEKWLELEIKFQEVINEDEKILQ